MAWTTAQLITTGTSVAALLLSVVNFGLARRAERRREELQRRSDATDADRLLDQAYDALFGPNGFATSPNWRRLDDARIAITRAKALAPTSSRVALYEGYLLETQHDDDGAREGYARAVALNDPQDEAYLSLGRLTDSEAGIQILLDAMKQRPSIAADAEWEIAKKLEEMSRHEEAVCHYELAIRGRPRFLDARLRLASLLERIGRPEDARATLEEAVTLHPTSAQALAALGRLLAGRGDWPAGYAMIEHAITVDPTNAEPYLLMVRLLVDKQDDTAARTWFDKAVRVKPTLYLQPDGRELAARLGLTSDGVHA